MTHQPGFSQAGFADKKKSTRREKFLARMEALIPWAKLLAVIEPFHPKGQRGRPPVGLERCCGCIFSSNGMALRPPTWRTSPDCGTAARAIATSPRRHRLYRRGEKSRDRGVGTEDRLADRAQAGADQSPGLKEPRKKTLKAVEKAKASVRAFVEHPFHILKNIFRHRKGRYRGLAKNGHQLYTLFGLANVVPGARQATA
jgi:IS5 family transposase